MTTKGRGVRLLLCLGLAAGAQAVSAAGFERLSRHGEEVLEICNPANSNADTRCRVTSLPGEPGYQLVASRSAPLIYNEVEIGTVYEKVWRKQSSPNLCIFGVRLVVNDAQWDSSGLSFNVNDVFRQTLPNRRVSVAYKQESASKPLKEAGRTVQGLNEFEEDEPERDNTWVGFRVDANANDPDGVSRPSTPWLLTKTRAPEGIDLNPLGLRVLNSDTEDFFAIVDLFTTSYQPNGVPPPEDDEEEEEEGED